MKIGLLGMVSPITVCIDDPVEGVTIERLPFIASTSRSKQTTERETDTHRAKVERRGVDKFGEVLAAM